MNIDAFLHKVHADIVQMKTAVTTINANMAKIHEVLASIANSKLFDLLIATAEVWVSVWNCMHDVCTHTCIHVHTYMHVLYMIYHQYSFVQDPDKFSIKMTAHVDMIREQVMVKVEEMQECIMAVMSVSTSVADILKSLRTQALHTPGSSSKPHSSARASVIAAEYFFRHRSKSRSYSVATTLSESERSHSLPRGSITSPAPSPQVPPDSARKPSQAVTFKPVETKPRIFEQLVSLLHAENRKSDLEIVHYFSKLLGDALLAAITSSLTMFKTSMMPRHNKSVSTHNKNSATSDNTTLLEFTTNVTFVIPESCLIPALKSIQCNINQVCTCIVAILQNVVWWGGSHSGKPLYTELQDDAKLKELLEFLSSCILGMLELYYHIVKHRINHLCVYDI